MTKPMNDLPMDTKNRDCTCGGPPECIETVCPKCGEKGVRVKSGTVRYLLDDEHRIAVTDKIYGLCLTPDCAVSWYAQGGSHFFTTDQTATPIWTKADVDPIMACYCNEITKNMVFDAVKTNGLNDMQDIIEHYRGKMKSMCAVKNPMGKCCSESFNTMIKEAQKNI